MSAVLDNTKPKRTARAKVAAAPAASPAPMPAPADPPWVEVAAANDGPATDIAEELVDRAEISNGTALVKLSKSEKLVADLRDEAAKIQFALVATDPDAEAAARKFRVKASASITALKEHCMALRRPAQEFSAMVIEAQRVVEKDMRAILALADEPLTDLDATRKAEQARKVEAEQAALKKIDDAIAAIASRPTALVGKPAADIAAALAVIDAIDITDEEFGTRGGDAMKAKLDAAASLRTMHAGALAMEQQQTELARQQSELATQRAAQSAIDAITGVVARAIGKSAAAVGELIAEVEAVDTMDDVFAGRDGEAHAARVAALSTLGALKAGADAAEALARQQAETQARLDEQQRAQQARQDALDRAEADRQAEAARVERERVEHLAAITARITRMVELPERLEAEEAPAVVIESELRTLNDTMLTLADYGDRLGEATSLKDRVLAELRNLHTLAVAAEEAAAAQAAADAAERQRLADEQAAAEATAAQARARAEAAREAAPLLVALLLRWRDADASGDEVALESARAERARLLETFSL